MVYTIDVDITPFTMFLGKVCYKEITEWELIDTYNSSNHNETISNYLDMLSSRRAIDINYDNLFLFLSLLRTMFHRRVPVNRNILTNIKVGKRTVKNNRHIVEVVYTFE